LSGSITKENEFIIIIIQLRIFPLKATEMIIYLLIFLFVNFKNPMYINTPHPPLLWCAYYWHSLCN